eukprot:TRINITY_DN1199_c0_g8_i1.p1 TRINITY_DN1199_c0_g8~~TRINITY_DN1199_c0_g8_i1.p1  ORF type:complete len:1831 (+),score=450.37 TRINITY_DN1199_c0_g8_i1:87-5579(+)
MSVPRAGRRRAGTTGVAQGEQRKQELRRERGDQAAQSAEEYYATGELRQLDEQLQERQDKVLEVVRKARSAYEEKDQVERELREKEAELEELGAELREARLEAMTYQRTAQRELQEQRRLQAMASQVDVGLQEREQELKEELERLQQQHEQLQQDMNWERRNVEKNLRSTQQKEHTLKQAIESLPEQINAEVQDQIARQLCQFEELGLDPDKVAEIADRLSSSPAFQDTAERFISKLERGMRRADRVLDSDEEGEESESSAEDRSPADTQKVFGPMRRNRRAMRDADHWPTPDHCQLALPSVDVSVGCESDAASPCCRLRGRALTAASAGAVAALAGAARLLSAGPGEWSSPPEQLRLNLCVLGDSVQVVTTSARLVRARGGEATYEAAVDGAGFSPEVSSLLSPARHPSMSLPRSVGQLSPRPPPGGGGACRSMSPARSPPSRTSAQGLGLCEVPPLLAGPAPPRLAFSPPGSPPPQPRVGCPVPVCGPLYSPGVGASTLSGRSAKPQGRPQCARSRRGSDADSRDSAALLAERKARHHQRIRAYEQQAAAKRREAAARLQRQEQRWQEHQHGREAGASHSPAPSRQRAGQCSAASSSASDRGSIPSAGPPGAQPRPVSPARVSPTRHCGGEPPPRGGEPSPAGSAQQQQRAGPPASSKQPPPPRAEQPAGVAEAQLADRLRRFALAAARAAGGAEGGGGSPPAAAGGPCARRERVRGAAVDAEDGIVAAPSGPCAKNAAAAPGGAEPLVVRAELRRIHLGSTAQVSGFRRHSQAAAHLTQGVKPLPPPARPPTPRSPPAPARTDSSLEQEQPTRLSDTDGSTAAGDALTPPATARAADGRGLDRSEAVWLSPKGPPGSPSAGGAVLGEGRLGEPSGYDVSELSATQVSPPGPRCTDSPAVGPSGFTLTPAAITPASAPVAVATPSSAPAASAPAATPQPDLQALAALLRELQTAAAATSGAGSAAGVREQLAAVQQELADMRETWRSLMVGAPRSPSPVVVQLQLPNGALVPASPVGAQQAAAPPTSPPATEPSPRTVQLQLPPTVPRRASMPAPGVAPVPVQRRHFSVGGADGASFERFPTTPMSALSARRASAMRVARLTPTTQPERRPSLQVGGSPAAMLASTPKWGSDAPWSPGRASIVEMDSRMQAPEVTQEPEFIQVGILSPESWAGVSRYRTPLGPPQTSSAPGHFDPAFQTWAKDAGWCQRPGVDASTQASEERTSASKDSRPESAAGEPVLATDTFAPPPHGGTLPSPRRAPAAPAAEAAQAATPEGVGPSWWTPQLTRQDAGDSPSAVQRNTPKKSGLPPLHGSPVGTPTHHLGSTLPHITVTQATPHTSGCAADFHVDPPQPLGVRRQSAEGMTLQLTSLDDDAPQAPLPRESPTKRSSPSKKESPTQRTLSHRPAVHRAPQWQLAADAANQLGTLGVSVQGRSLAMMQSGFGAPPSPQVGVEMLSGSALVAHQVEYEEAMAQEVQRGGDCAGGGSPPSAAPSPAELRSPAAAQDPSAVTELRQGVALFQPSPVSQQGPQSAVSKQQSAAGRPSPPAPQHALGTSMATSGACGPEIEVMEVAEFSFGEPPQADAPFERRTTGDTEVTERRFSNSSQAAPARIQSMSMSCAELRLALPDDTPEYRSATVPKHSSDGGGGSPPSPHFAGSDRDDLRRVQDDVTAQIERKGSLVSLSSKAEHEAALKQMFDEHPHLKDDFLLCPPQEQKKILEILSGSTAIPDESALRMSFGSAQSRGSRKGLDTSLQETVSEIKKEVVGRRKAGQSLSRTTGWGSELANSGSGAASMSQTVATLPGRRPNAKPAARPTTRRGTAKPGGH